MAHVFLLANKHVLALGCWAAGRQATGTASAAASSVYRASQPARAFATEGSGGASQASTSGQGGENTSAGAWTHATAPLFSIRPSYLSPLYSTFVRGRERDERRELVKTLLRAHAMLAPQVASLDDIQAEASARDRISQMRRLCNHLSQLRDLPGLTQAVSSQADMQGLFTLLDQQATAADSDAGSFSALGEDSSADAVWHHWSAAFAQRYADAPGLEALETVFSRPEPQVLLQRMRWGAARAASAAALSTAGPISTGLAGERRLGEVDLQGNARAWGRRKSSNSEVKLLAGSGRIIVNGLPYDSYFRDITLRSQLLKPLFITDTLNRYDVEASVEGGGLSGQSQALQHGMARALALVAPEHQRRLRHLTVWDGRQVERKKPARHKARTGWTYVRR